MATKTQTTSKSQILFVFAVNQMCVPYRRMPYVTSAIPQMWKWQYRFREQCPSAELPTGEVEQPRARV